LNIILIEKYLSNTLIARLAHKSIRDYFCSGKLTKIYLVRAKKVTKIFCTIFIFHKFTSL